jgi:hypothetical protein
VKGIEEGLVTFVDTCKSVICRIKNLPVISWDGTDFGNLFTEHLERKMQKTKSNRKEKKIFRAGEDFIFNIPISLTIEKKFLIEYKDGFPIPGD